MMYNQNKDKTIQFRVSKDEKKFLEETAKRRNFKNVSEYVKYCILREQSENMINLKQKLYNQF